MYVHTTRHGQEEPAIQPKHKRTQKTGGDPSAKRGRRKHQAKIEDIIGAADSEVEIQLQAMMVDEDGVEEESEHERPPRHEIFKNIVQMTRGQAAGSSATAKGRSVVRGRDKEKGSAASS